MTTLITYFQSRFFMRKLFFLVFILIILLLSTNSIYTARDLIFRGEYLEYDVSFWGIHLGKIKVTTLYDSTINDVNYHTMEAFFKSADHIPFINLDSQVKTWMDMNLTHSSHCESRFKNSEDKWVDENYFYDFDKNTLRSEIYLEDSLSKTITYTTTKKWLEGLSLFFYARRHINEKKVVTVPTIMNSDTSTTWFNFKNEIESVSIDAFDYKLRSVYLNGTAFWKGLYGMSGNFEGWFSDDEASIPLLSKVSVYIGSVNIELVKWTRKGWSPPKYQ